MRDFIVHLYLSASNLQTPPTQAARKVREICVKQNKPESKWVTVHDVLCDEYKWLLFGSSKISPTLQLLTFNSNDVSPDEKRAHRCLAKIKRASGELSRA